MLLLLLFFFLLLLIELLLFRIPTSSSLKVGENKTKNNLRSTPKPPSSNKTLPLIPPISLNYGSVISQDGEEPKGKEQETRKEREEKKRKEKKKKNRKLTANFDRSLQFQQNRLANEDFSSLHAQTTNLNLVEGHISSRATSPHL